MINQIVKFSVRFRGVIIALSCLFLFYGIATIQESRYDVFPEFVPPQVVIQTEAPGLAPEQVEALVTQPIENILNGVAGISSLRSESIQGLSLITVNFQSASDIFRDRQSVAERLSSLGSTLPQGVETPRMSPLTSSAGDVMTIGLTSKEKSLTDLRTVADWVIQPKLLAVPGVAKIGIFGGRVKEIQIQIQPHKLVEYGLSISEVVSAANRATGVQGAGFIDTAKQRIVLRTIGQSIKPEDLSKIVLTHNLGNLGSVSIRLGEIAKIEESFAPPFGSAAVEGEEGVVLNVWAQYGANTLEVTRGLDEALKSLEPNLRSEKITLDPTLFRSEKFIQSATKNVRFSMWIGAILVVGVLLLFLSHFRSAAISCTAIPLSILTAISVLNRMGYTLNTMTLGGLAIAIGEVVDDAIIDVENILRRLRENRTLPNPCPARLVIWKASLEVRQAVVYATFAVALVFLPILTMTGLTGRLFAPLGLAYILATMASLLVALTTTPALCTLLSSSKSLEDKETRFVSFIKRTYCSFLSWADSGHSMALLIFGIGVMVGGLLTLPYLGGEFLPQLREGHYIIHVSLSPDSSLSESLRVGKAITKALFKIPYVRTVAQRAGRAAADDVYGTYYSEIEVDMKPLTAQQAEEAPLTLRKVVESFPDVRQFEVNTFLNERIDETLSGYTSSVVINIFGKDLDVLDQKSNEVAKIIKTIPGANEVQVQSVSGTPQMNISLRRPELAHWGFSPLDVLEAIQSAYRGRVAGQIYDGNRVFNLTAVLDPKERKDPEDIGELTLRSPTGLYVRLSELADISLVKGRYNILHESAQRVGVVTCDVDDRDIHSFVEEARKRIRTEIQWPSDISVEFSGADVEQSRSKRDLLIHSILAGVAILLLLSIIMRNFRNTTLVLANLPFAFIGGLITAWIMGGTLSVGALVGFVTLFGITLRNSIMMMSHFEHLVTEEKMEWNRMTMLQGASERLVPVLMTALVTALGLLPLAIGYRAPGREIEGPMAQIILGGLATSTLLNLLVLPILAHRFARFYPKD